MYGESRSVALLEDGLLYLDGHKTHVQFSYLTRGDDHALAFTEYVPSLYIWGSNDHLQLGYDNKPIPNYPVQVPHVQTGSYSPLYPNDEHVNREFLEVYCSKTTSFGLQSSGVIYSWGDNEYGQCGDGGDYKNRALRGIVPNFLDKELECPDHKNRALRNVIPNLLAKKLACADHFILALSITDGQVYVWGHDPQGYFGHPCERIPTPRLFHMPKLTDLTCGSDHILGIGENNEVYAWGNNDRGQLGLGDLECRKSPTVITELKLDRVYCGNNFSIGINLDQKFLVWGDNSSGQLEINSGTQLLTKPTYLSDLQIHRLKLRYVGSSSENGILIQEPYIRNHNILRPLGS